MPLCEWLIFVFAAGYIIWIDGVAGMEKIEGSYGIDGPHDGREETTVTFTQKYGKSKSLNLRVICQNNAIGLRMNTTDIFTGMVYPQDSNKDCMAKYVNISSTFNFTIPLKGCNTKTKILEDGIELHNVFVLGAHTSLVGPGAQHVRVTCKFHNHIQTVHTNFTTNFNASVVPTKVFNVSQGPRLYMAILLGDPSSKTLAMEVSVGQNLTLIVGMEDYDIYSMKVFNCSVESGLGNKQELHDENGCAIDNEIMEQFSYSQDGNVAFVQYHAHKFPTTNSVYYKCSIKLCVKNQNISCSIPPICPDGSDTKSVSNNEMSYKTSGERTPKSFYDALQNARSPRMLDSLSQEDEPIIEELTPELIEQLFYSDETSMRLNAESQVGNMIQLQNLTDLIAYNFNRNGTFHLEFGLRVVDEAEMPAVAERRHAAKSIQEILGISIEVKRCWHEVEVRAPCLAATSSFLTTCICLVFLGVHVCKHKNKPNRSSGTTTNRFEMREVAPRNASCTCQYPNTGPTSLMECREFNRSQGLPNIKDKALRRQLAREAFHRGPIRGKVYSYPSLEQVVFRQ